MIDVHSHIIPNVDDGSSSVNETFKMIEEARKIGFTDIILTSHFLLNCYETNSKELVFWKEKLQEVLDKKEIDVKLHSGMEIYISSQMEELIKKKKLLTLGNSRYMLIELPLSSTVKNLDYVLYFLESISIKPIIAHPERYKCVQENPELVEEYINKGALIQCNYASILGLYGDKAKKTVKKLLKNNLVDFLGSDCHKPNQIYLLVPEAIKKIKKIIGDSRFEKISTLNPQKILKNEEWEYDEKN